MIHEIIHGLAPINKIDIFYAEQYYLARRIISKEMHQIIGETIFAVIINSCFYQITNANNSNIRNMK